MRSRRRDLVALIFAVTFTGSCMIPRSEMLEEKAHHVRTHRELKARFGHEATECLPQRLDPDPATSSPRPPPEEADHTSSAT